MENLHTIIFVDDEQNILDSIKRIIKKEELELNALYFSNSKEALETIKQQSENIVIVSDWQMPFLNGIDLCREVRKFEKSNLDVKHHFILLTSWDNDESYSEAFESGVDEYLVKPVKKPLLLAKLKISLRLIQLEQQLKNKPNQLADAS